MTFVDTNVILDILSDDPRWGNWSTSQLSQAAERGEVTIDAIIIAELSRSFATLADLQRKIDALCLQLSAVDEMTAFVAGHRFAAYRKTRDQGIGPRVLPDFFIGAHALILNVPLLTRDARLYRTYFPDLTLITPETDND